MPRKSQETQQRQSAKRGNENESLLENKVPGNALTQTANQSPAANHSLSVLSEYCANLYELLRGDNQEVFDVNSNVLKSGINAVDISNPELIAGTGARNLNLDPSRVQVANNNDNAADISKRKANIGSSNLDSSNTRFVNNNNPYAVNRNQCVRCNASNQGKSCVGHKVLSPCFREIVRRKYALPRDDSEAERSNTPTRFKGSLSVLREMEQTGNTFSRNGVFSRNETRSTQVGGVANKTDAAAVSGSAARAGILVRNEGTEEVVHFNTTLSILREMERMEAVLPATSSKTAPDEAMHKSTKRKTETDPNMDYLSSDSSNDLTIDLDHDESNSPKLPTADHESDEHDMDDMDVDASLYSVPDETEAVDEWNGTASEEDLLLQSDNESRRRDGAPADGLADDNEKSVFVFTGNDGPADDPGDGSTRKRPSRALVSTGGPRKAADKCATVTKETSSVRRIPVIQAKRFCFMATQSDGQTKQVAVNYKNPIQISSVCPKQIPVVISTCSHQIPVITCMSRKTKTPSPVRPVMPLLPIALSSLPKIDSIQKTLVDIQASLATPNDMSDVQNKPTDIPDVRKKTMEIPADIHNKTRESDIRHKQGGKRDICDTAIKIPDVSSEVVAIGLRVKSIQPNETSTVASEPIDAANVEAETSIADIPLPEEIKEIASIVAEPPPEPGGVNVVMGGLPTALASGGASVVLTSVCTKPSEPGTCAVASEAAPIVGPIAAEPKPGSIFPQSHPTHKVVDLTSTDMKIVDSMKTVVCEKSVNSAKRKISTKTDDSKEGGDSTKTVDSTKTEDSVKDVYCEKTEDSKEGVDSMKAVDSKMTVASTKTEDSTKTNDSSKDSTKVEDSAKSKHTLKTKDAAKSSDVWERPDGGNSITPYKSSLTKPWPTFKPYTDPILLPTVEKTTPACQPAAWSTNYVSNDPAENEDNDSAAWAPYRSLQSDEERFLHLRKEWGTGGLPNPNRDLTFRHRAAAAACGGSGDLFRTRLLADMGEKFVAKASESAAGSSASVAGPIVSAASSVTAAKSGVLAAGQSKTAPSFSKPLPPAGAAVAKVSIAPGPSVNGVASSDAPTVGARPKLSIDNLGSASAPLPGSLIRSSANATAPLLQKLPVIPVRSGTLVPIPTMPISEPIIYPVISERVAQPLNANVVSNFSRMNATVTSGMLPISTETTSEPVFFEPPRSSGQTASKLDNPESVSSIAVIPDSVASVAIKKTPPSFSLVPYAVMTPDPPALPPPVTSEATTPTMFDLPEDSVDPYDDAMVGSGSSPPDEVQTPINPIRSVLRLSRPASGSLARLTESSPCGSPQVVGPTVPGLEPDARRDGAPADPGLPNHSRCQALPRGLKRSLEFDQEEPEQQQQPPRKRARTIPCVAVLERHLSKTVAEKEAEMAEIEQDRARALEQLRREQAQETSEALAAATRSRRRFFADKLRAKHSREYHSKNRSYDEAVREVSNEIEAANKSLVKAAEEISNFRSFYHNAGRSQATTSLINQLEFDEAMEVFDFYDDLVNFYAPDQPGGSAK